MQEKLILHKYANYKLVKGTSKCDFNLKKRQAVHKTNLKHIFLFFLNV